MAAAAESEGAAAAAPVGSGDGSFSSPPGPRSAVPAKKRDLSQAGVESSPGSIDDGVDDDLNDDRRRTPGVKRACNECRQQKLRCDVSQDPFVVCSRCRRLKLDCKIESNFKRVGKRSKNAEMEREIVELRRQLAATQGQTPMQSPPISMHATGSHSPEVYHAPRHPEHFMGPDEAVASLLDLRQGLDGGGAGFLKAAQGALAGLRTLDNVTISGSCIAQLFSHFFRAHHPFLPILDPTKSPDHYHDTCPLLFWAIVSVAARRFPQEPNLFAALPPVVSKLLWSTLADVPQSYHVVKALCLLCTWPFPISSTSADATFMLSGVMTHVAMQIGLHRPSHAQDFSKYHIQVRDEELRDRVRTWAACNVVAQSVSTGYGQPPSSLFDWTLKPSVDKEESYRLSAELDARLRIEKFCDKVTKGLYSSTNDPVGLTDDVGRASISSLLAKEFDDLEASLRTHGSAISTLHLRAAGLHLRLSAFFDSSTAKDYQQNLLSLYFATTAFLNNALELEAAEAGLFAFATNYILQMMVAAAFTLFKLLNSFFAKHIDLDDGKALFHRTIAAIRKISVMTNDLPSRLAEVLAQLWRGGGEGARVEGRREGDVDGSLQLKVRCRMSMSLVYDSVWRWREEFQEKGRGNLDSAVINPTNPDAAADESSGPTVSGPSLNVPLGLAMAGPAQAMTPGPSNGLGEPNYEVFDPLNWMLDGFVDFPYSLATGAGIEEQSIA